MAPPNELHGYWFATAHRRRRRRSRRLFARRRMIITTPNKETFVYARGVTVWIFRAKSNARNLGRICCWSCKKSTIKKFITQNIKGPNKSKISSTSKLHTIGHEVQPVGLIWMHSIAGDKIVGNIGMQKISFTGYPSPWFNIVKIWWSFNHRYFRPGIFAL